MAAKKPEDDRSLKRLGGGRWQTRDERFTIEPQSGTWVIVDADQTDDLGLPLVRGPFRSLTDAKAAVEAARGAAAPESPLAERVKDAKPARPKAAATKPAGRDATAASKGGHEPAAAEARRASKAAEEPEPPPEPRWISALAPRDRGRARRLIEQLDDAGVRDAEGIVRQDLTGGVPTVARLAIADELVALLPASDADAAERLAGRLAEAVDHGRDEALDVRWRLVDGDDRPIGLTAADIRAALKRRAGPTTKEAKR
jgi:hypothetical protein